MKQFLCRSLLFILIPVIFLLIGLILPGYPGAKSSYLFAKLDKDALLKNTDTPRIILLGGSNLALSMNSVLLKDSLGLNPVNTGLDYDIGLTHIISYILPYIRKGDIVILASEYEQFFGRLLYGGYPCPMIEFEISPWRWNRLSLNQWINLIRVIPGYALPRLKIWKYFSAPATNTDGNYMRSSFNRFGDHIAHWQMKTKHPAPTNGYEGVFNDNAIKALQEFEAAVKKKDAILVITYPPYQAASFSRNQVQIRSVQTAFQAAGFTLLGTPERYSMPDSLMFDSPYHLVKEGVDKRTELLIEDLKKAMPNLAK